MQTINSIIYSGSDTWVIPNSESSAAFGLRTTRWNVNFHQSNPFDYLYFYDCGAVPDSSTATDKQSQGPFPPKHLTHTNSILDLQRIPSKVSDASKDCRLVFLNTNPTALTCGNALCLIPQSPNRALLVFPALPNSVLGQRTNSQMRPEAVLGEPMCPWLRIHDYTL